MASTTTSAPPTSPRDPPQPPSIPDRLGALLCDPDEMSAVQHSQAALAADIQAMCATVEEADRALADRQTALLRDLVRAGQLCRTVRSGLEDCERRVRNLKETLEKARS